jgi:hypothetical protein
MTLIPNSSVGVARFGYILFGMAVLSSVMFFIAFPSDSAIQFFDASIAVTGLVAISAASQLKKLEDRLDKIEGRSGQPR